MSRAETVTKLPMAEWARIMGINPLHFCQVQIPQTQVTTVGGAAWYQYDWQDNDRVSRDALARTIKGVEDDIELYLGYRLLPAWEQDEWRPTTRPYHPETVNLNDHDIRGRNQQIKLNWGQMISGGIRAKTLIEATSAITWGSTFAPATYEDTGTVTVATTVTDPQEIHVYFPGRDADDSYEVRPINVSIAGGVATITFRRELVVLPVLQESMDFGDTLGAVDGLDDDNFESTVDVYRVYLDPQQQATLLWEPPGCTADTPLGEYTAQTGVLWLRGDRANPATIYVPATWDAVTEQFDAVAYAVGRQPDILRTWYYAGWEDRRAQNPKPRITMDSDLARAVAFMAAARLDRDDCGGFDISRYRQDLAVQEFEGDRSRLPANLIGNPFGTRRGEVEAFQKLRTRGKGQVSLA